MHLALCLAVGLLCVYMCLCGTCVYVCVCVCVRARVCVCMRARVRARTRVCVHNMKHLNSISQSDTNTTIIVNMKHY